MRVAYLKLCGFRGYSKPIAIEFARGFTVIDGRNGVGKSSIFDAIEFVLLGTIQKYDSVSAAGETADDYIWWRGPGSSPTERFVEVGFEIEGNLIPLKRTMLEGPDPSAFEKVTSSILSLSHAPPQALNQLCATSIIRDEKIAALSLDLKESDRFKQLRDALGAADAEEWISRASRIHELAKRRRGLAEQELSEAATSASLASSRLEETRRSIPDPRLLDEATARLRQFSGGDSADEFRQAVVSSQTNLDTLLRLENSWPEIVGAHELIERTAQESARAEENRSAIATQEQDFRSQLVGSGGSAELRSESQSYATLLTSGERIGLQEGHCPLCAADRTPEEFASGIELGRRKVQGLDAKALERAQLEQKHNDAILQLHAADAEIARLKSSIEAAQRRLTDYANALSTLGLGPAAGLEELRERRQHDQQGLAQARQDLAIIETMRLAASIDSQVSAVEAAQIRRKMAEGRLGIARRAENRAKALFDAARRTSGEILNQRLDVVMPLMSEFYRRLRPHPIWEDIDYRLRGDVQRSLLLQVGDELNPQFIYSSGQRRATGLAFLLSVNMSLSWNNWKSILLDDPVQHIDDFRSVHLAEVLAQIVRTGRQLICAAEDEALADLIARHIPVSPEQQGKRISLGIDRDGALAVLREQSVGPHPSRTFASSPPTQTAL